MTIIDYLLIGGFAAAVIYTLYRLFQGWRNSAFTQDESEIGDELNVTPESVPDGRVATGTPWNQRAKERLNVSNFEN